jgi:hypothetical protein
MRVALHEVAHSRAGDKGTLTTLSLIPYDERDYPALREAVTAESVEAHLSDRVTAPVTRFELDGLTTLLFVCPRLPGDSVTTSLHLDAHGKSLSSALLELAVDIDSINRPRADGGPHE